MAHTVLGFKSDGMPVFVVEETISHFATRNMFIKNRTNKNGTHMHYGSQSATDWKEVTSRAYAANIIVAHIFSKRRHVLYSRHLTMSQ